MTDSWPPATTPAEWENVQLIRLARLGTGHTPSRSEPEYWENCTIPWLTVSDLGSLSESDEVVVDTEQQISELGLANSAAVLLPAGTVALSRTASVGYSVILGRDMAMTQGFVAWTCGPMLRPQFLLYQLRAMRPYLRAIARGSTHTTIFFPDVKALRVVVPPVRAQDEIVDWVKRRFDRVDRLVDKKRRLIELLKEKRTALIGHAVSASNSDPTVKMGHFVDLLPGYAFPSSGFIHDGGESDGVRLLRGVNVAPGSIRWDNAVRWPMNEYALFRRYHLASGDLVFGMDRPWIGAGVRVARITEQDLPSLLLQRVARLRSREGLDQEYLELVMASRQFLAYFEPILTGVSVPHVSPEQILSFRFRLPSSREQSRTLETLRPQFTAMRELEAKVRQQLDKLAEYRQALITAAVTGQIDVTEYQSDPESVVA